MACWHVIVIEETHIDQGWVQNYDIDAANIVGLLSPQQSASCLQCLKHGLAVTCSRILRSVNYKRCLLAGHKESYSK
ncbi:hypothetical protein MMC22_000829, partial [Lobaria immixta]|nr:hypothetical protein [Lobaria immixta]